MAFTVGDLGHVIEHNAMANQILGKVNTSDIGTTIDTATAGYISTGGVSATKTALVGVLKKRAWLASDHGVVGDGVANDGPALNMLLIDAAAAGARVLLAQNSVLSIRTRVFVPSNTRLDGQSATLRNDMTASPGDIVLQINNVSNVLIENLNIDGNKAAYATVTEFKHGISMTQASRVTLRGVTSNRNKGDGVYVGGTVTAFCSDIVLDRVTCDANHRNGLSIISVKGFQATSSKFTRSSGTNPQAGLDLEPNTADAPMERIKFIACEFTENTNQGIDVAAWSARTVKQGDVDFIGCSADGNFGSGVKMVTGDGIRFIGGSISRNADKGVWFSSAAGTTSEVLFQGVRIVENAGKGVLTDAGFSGLTFSACRVYGNTTAAASIGLDIIPVAASTDLKVVGCSLGGATQTHGLRTGANVSNTVIVGNSYPDVGIAVSLSDNPASRTTFGAEGASLVATSVTRSASGSTGAGFRSPTDTVDKVLVRCDGSIGFSSGTAAADATLARLGVGVLGVGAGHVLRTGRNATGSRPSAAVAQVGSMFFDTTLAKPIWSDGTVWRDGAGTAV